MTCCILQITIEQTLLHSGEEVSQTDDMEKETLSQKIRSHKSLRRDTRKQTDSSNKNIA